MSVLLEADCVDDLTVVALVAGASTAEVVNDVVRSSCGVQKLKIYITKIFQHRRQSVQIAHATNTGLICVGAISLARSRRDLPGH
jgi:hypothetical protein